jgi:phosphoribosylanthranilate isomerase
MTRVKICGLTREEDVDAAVDAGADAVGFVSGFPSSPRNLSLARAASLISRVPPLVTAVLVTTVDALASDPDEVKRAAPGALQLYGGGSTSPALVRSEFHVRHLIRPHHVMGRKAEGRRDDNDDDDDNEEEEDMVVVAVPSLAAIAREAVAGYDALLLDTYAKGRDGGTGMTSDWDVCADIRRSIEPVPLFLSGGLTPENVGEAINKVTPFCVDASSGVESTPGIKDGRKVRAFVSRAMDAVERRDGKERGEEKRMTAPW